MTSQYPSFPVPENEARRLEALRSYAILDSAPEMDFDALTRVAAHTFDVPVAVVGLLDADRLWIKSHFGDVAPQMDRQIAFCAHAVMQPDEVLVVQNLAEDPRFTDNPLVANKPHLRFYAAAPLVDDKRNVLGTIAIVDTHPREFSEVQCRILQDYAILVMMALENHRRAVQLTHFARTDHLTSLLNRAAFESSMRTQLAHCARTGEKLAVLYMDLDGFKMVNDQFGHAAGDEVLRVVAQRLRSEVREEDVLARLGGDEFAVMVRGNAEAANKLAMRIESCMRSPFLLTSGESIYIGISVGVANCETTDVSHEVMLARADKDLYSRKQARSQCRQQ